MANVNVTPQDLIPGLNRNKVVFSGAVAAQSDTITLTGVSEIWNATGMIDSTQYDPSAHWMPAIFRRDSGVANRLILSGTASGILYGEAWVDW